MFWYTSDTVKRLMGETYHAWELFGPVHLFWLFLATLGTAAVWLLYPKLDKQIKRRITLVMMILMIADELFKDIPALITGQFVWELLPFHLCSVNIFVTIIHTIRENRVTKAILTCVCIPAAFCALFMPTWTALPIWNYSHIHSETIHIMLFLFPMLLLADGYRPEKRDAKVLAAYICGLAIVDKGINAVLGTNFLFLTHNENNPALMFLQNLTGPFYNLGIVLFLIVFCSGMIFLWNMIPVKKKG